MAHPSQLVDISIASIRDLSDHLMIKADEKRQLIDGLYFNMIEIAKGGKQMVRATQQSTNDSQ